MFLEQNSSEGKQKMSRLLKLSVFVMLVIFLASSVFALGITPGRISVNFEPEMEKEGEFTIINSEGRQASLIVYVRGELNESIELGEEKVLMNADEGERKIKYKLNLPQELAPGLHTAEVVVLQVPEKVQGEKDETAIGAVLAVVMQVYVYVPYPGKYVEAGLNVYGTEREKRFVIAMIGRGKEKIEKASAEIEIYDKEGNKVDKIETNSVSVNALERKEIFAEWNADAPYGKYKAKAVLDYDGNKVLLEKEFEVGEMTIDLQQIFVKDFRLGEVAKFNMIVKNKWNEMIKNVYSEMRVYDKEMNEIDSIKSATYDIPAGMQTTMNYYWDTQNVSVGLYNANIILHYAEKKTQQDLKLDVSQDKIDVIGLGYVISEAGSSRNKSIINWLIAIIAFLALTNIIWFFILRNKLKKS